MKVSPRLHRTSLAVLAVFVLVLLAPDPLAQGRRKKRAPKPQPQPAKQAEAPAKKPGAKDAAPKLDPATEADRVTQSAENQAARAEDRERTFTEHFRVCDLDASGWISFREAEATLGIDRTEFRRYDVDQDGRIGVQEFHDRSQALLTLLGAVQPPKTMGPEIEPDSDLSATDPDAPPSLLPSDLIARADLDESGGLSRDELARLLEELAAPMQAELVLAKNDTDGSGALEEEELAAVSNSLARLANQNEPAGEKQLSSQSGMRRIEGPARHFQRLDADGDGAIDEDDLRACLGSARIELRLAGVLGALDQDGDRRLDEPEFLGAFRKARAQ